MTNIPQIAIPTRRYLSESFASSTDRQQWLEIISAILARVAIPSEELDDAISTYHALGDSLSDILAIDRNVLDIHGQGSVVHKTVMRSHGNANFDVDAVCNRLSSIKKNADEWFYEVGEALTRIPWVRQVEQKNRCWRVFFKDKKYYIDLTPSQPDGIRKETFIEVFSSEEPYPTNTNPSPSDPRGYSQWFSDIADKAPLLESVSRSVVLAKVEPIDTSPVHQLDVLRRAIQLMKFHRDNYYRGNDKLDASHKPISVILTTLATKSFERHRDARLSPLDLLVQIVDDMWDVPKKSGEYWVENPAHALENFADKWPKDNGARSAHYFRWLDQFGGDLALLKDPSARENQVQNAFGSVGVEGWKAAHEAGSAIVKRLADTAPKQPATLPTRNSTLA